MAVDDHRLQTSPNAVQWSVPPHGLGGPRTGVWTAASAAAGGGTGGEITWSEELQPRSLPPAPTPWSAWAKTW